MKPRILLSKISVPRVRARFSVAWIGVAVTVAATAASLAQQKKAAAQAKASQDAAIGALPGKAKAAQYIPVDFTDEQAKAIFGNLKNAGNAEDLMKTTNLALDRDAMTRAVHFIPNYRENMRLEGQNTTDLLNGRLPYDDVLDIVANRSASNSALGTPGTAGPATLRDLGLSRLDAIKTGSGLMQNMVSIAEQVNPVGRRYRPQDSYVSPSDRISMAMQQAQLVQNSQQNKYNADAGISPQQQAGISQAFGPQSNGPDYGAAIAQLGPQLAAAYRSNQTANTYSTAADPQLYRSNTSFQGQPVYYSAPPPTGYSAVPNLSYRPANYSIPAA